MHGLLQSGAVLFGEIDGDGERCLLYTSAAYLLVHRKEETQNPPDGQRIAIAGEEI